MKQLSILTAMVASATFGLFGCSSESADATSSVSVGDMQEQMGNANIATLSVQDAKAHLARYRHSVVNSWQFENESSEYSDSASVEIDSTLQSEGFAVDAEVSVEDDSVYTIAAAGVESDGAAWMVQVESGAIVYSWRENSNAAWHKFTTGKIVSKKDLNNVRVERAKNVVVIFVNGSIVGAFRDDMGASFKVTGKLTIGFDLKEKGKCHCQNGKVEQLGVETVDEIEDAPMDSVQVTDTVQTVVDTIALVSDSAVTEWIAEWDFNDAANVGLDVTGHGHDAVAGEGAVSSDSGIASFDGESGLKVSLENDIKINEFVVEARVKPTQFGTMQNIIVAESPGRGVDGWQLRVDEGVLTVHLRDTEKDVDDWNVFPGKEMTLNEWSEIRLERSADSVKLFQDGEVTVAVAYTGDLTQMAYDWSIGYDGMNQSFHDRYFIGEMDYIRFGVFKGFTEGTVVTKNEWLLAAWEFNEPKFVGLDRMANNSTKVLVGNPVVVDTTVALDGESGLPIRLSRLFMRNTFAVTARVKPTEFGEMQNIVVAEPPGRYGDGWIIRVDDGVLTVHFRDADVDGTEWNVLKGKELALGEWNDIRVERTADSVIVYQNGQRTAWAGASGDVSQLGYDIGIAYDAVNQTKHERFFNGEIDYIRFYGL